MSAFEEDYRAIQHSFLLHTVVDSFQHLKTVSAPECCRLQFSRVDLLSPSRRFLPVFPVKIMSSPIKGTLETILVVDDNEVILQAVVGILKHANFNVLSAANGPAAMRLAAESDMWIHLLLSDVDMPEMSGPDLGQKLKKTRPDIRIMLMSGGNNGNLLVLNYGWAYIQKPFLSARLVDMITAVLHSPDRSQAGGQEFDTRKDARGDQKSS
jgi:CheY-like chemotaxis protein